jgi:hypothetical protein
VAEDFRYAQKSGAGILAQDSSYHRKTRAVNRFVFVIERLVHGLRQVGALL